MSRTGWSNSDLLRVASGLVTAAPCTIACWANVPNHTSQVNLFGVYNSTDVTGNRNQFALLLTTGAQVGARTSGASGGNTASTSNTFTDGSWFHACGVFASATDRRAFVNGGGKATNASSQTPSGLDRISVGCQDISSGTSTIPSGSLVAELAIWNIALADADVALLAAGYSPKVIQPANLIAYWPVIGDWTPEIELIAGLSLSIQGSLSQGAHPPAQLLPYYNVGTQPEMFHPGRGVYSRARFFQSPRHASGVASGSGSLSVTLADVSLASTATLKLAAALSQTLANVTLSSASAVQIKAALAATLADASLSSAAQLQIRAALSAVLDDAVLSAVGISIISGALAITLDEVTLVATGNDGWTRIGKAGGTWTPVPRGSPTVWTPVPKGGSDPWTKIR